MEICASVAKIMFFQYGTLQDVIALDNTSVSQNSFFAMLTLAVLQKKGEDGEDSSSQ